MFNFFKKQISKEEENKLTITKIEIIKYKNLIKKIVGNRGDTLYKFVDEYNKRNIKNLDVEIRSTILKYYKYDTPEEFELDLFNTYFSELLLMYLETKKYIMSIDWKGEDTKAIINFVNDALEINKEEKISFEILIKLENKIQDENICVYSSDFLFIVFKLIDNDLKKIGYSLYFINDQSDTYHIFLAKSGSITEEEQIINFWATDIDDYTHNGLGREIKAGMILKRMKIHTDKNETHDLERNTIFFINSEDNNDMSIETINCDNNEVYKGKVVKDNLYFDIIC